MDIKKVVKLSVAGIGVILLFGASAYPDATVKSLLFVGSIFFALIPHFIGDKKPELEPSIRQLKMKPQFEKDRYEHPLMQQNARPQMFTREPREPSFDPEYRQPAMNQPKMYHPRIQDSPFDGDDIPPMPPRFQSTRPDEYTQQETPEEPTEEQAQQPMNFKCGICNAKYTSKSSLSKHIMKDH